MSPRQKVLFVQIQIALCGLLIAGFGLVWKEWLLMLFGFSITAYGALRFWLLGKVMQQSEDLPDNLEQAFEKEKRERRFRLRNLSDWDSSWDEEDDWSISVPDLQPAPKQEGGACRKTDADDPAHQKPDDA